MNRRVAVILIGGVLGCGGPGAATPIEVPDRPLQDPALEVLPDRPADGAVDAGAAPEQVIDGGAAAPIASLTATEVSWPTDRRPAQLHFLGGGTAESAAVAVSADGSTPIGHAHVLQGQVQPVRWRDGMLTPLAGDGGGDVLGTWPTATSRNGDIVAGFDIAQATSTSTALVWRKDASAAVLPTPDGLQSARARAVSRDGSTIVGCAGACTKLVTWSRGTWEVLETPADFTLANHPMSENGAVLAGNIARSGVSEAVRLTGKKVERLGKDTHVEGISDDGAVLVGSSGGRAALWRGTKLTDLGVVPSYDTCAARAVSADGGRVVGTCRRETGDHHPSAAFIWDKKKGMRTVQEALEKEYGIALASGVELAEAADICGFGLTVVGVAHGPTSGVEAWMAIVPRP